MRWSSHSYRSRSRCSVEGPPFDPASFSPAFVWAAGAATLVTSSGRWQEPDLLVNGGQCRAGDLPRPGGAGGEHPIELSRIVQVHPYPFSQRLNEVGDDVGEVLLQVAVAFARVLRLQLGDLPVGER